MGFHFTGFWIRSVTARKEKQVARGSTPGGFFASWIVILSPNRVPFYLSLQNASTSTRNSGSARLLALITVLAGGFLLNPAHVF